MHYVLHEIKTGELIEVSEKPFKAQDVPLGYAVEFFKTVLPNQDLYEWNPKYLMWRKR